MLAIVTADAMRQAERRADAPEGELMRRAAEQIASWISHRFDQRPGVIAALVGPGNNGGDAICALALLAERGWTTLALPVLREETGELPVEREAVEKIQWVAKVEHLAHADVILDGVFGNGSRPELPDTVREITRAIERIRGEHGTPVVAIDVPTGVDSDSGEADEAALRCDVTLAIAFPKAGLLHEPTATLAGDLEIIDIGLSNPADHAGPWLITRADVVATLPRRGASAHKHDVGGVLVVGGAPTYFGAPRLAGAAALRAGAGYVGLAVPRSIIASSASALPELVYHPLSDGDGRRSAEQVRKALDEFGSRYRAVVIGPGVGRDEVAEEMLTALLAADRPDQTEAESPDIGFGIPRRRVARSGDSTSHEIFDQRNLVIDADALYWLSQRQDWPADLRDLDAVLTPHVGELARLLGRDIEEIRDDPVAATRELARESGQTIVLKHGYSCVCAPDGTIAHAPRATPELASPGTGDALAGMIGTFLALGLDRFNAATAALYVGAHAGRQAREVLGAYSVTASDLIESIPRVLRELLEPTWDEKGTNRGR